MKLKTIYAYGWVGSNGVHCLDYKNYDSDTKYIRNDKYEKLEEQNKEMLDALISEAKFQCREMDGASNTIVSIIEKATGMKIEDILKKK